MWAAASALACSNSSRDISSRILIFQQVQMLVELAAHVSYQARSGRPYLRRSDSRSALVKETPPLVASGIFAMGFIGSFAKKTHAHFEVL
jgi:hypothetical protein